MTEPITHSLVKMLRRVPSLESLNDEALLQIVGASANLFWSAGGLVFSKGDFGDALYLVLSGRVRIFDVDGDGSEQDVGYVDAGDYFGEQSLLANSRRTRSAQAAEDSELMVLPGDYVGPLLAANPELAAHFEATILARTTPD
ncbi:MAG: cyclic nucleotide-binding domain-containing protein [Euzebyaceae bacterium]|nr:cyclic nucleotide-binding domain-containing protein [Euzebyaceae bacterium]